MHMPLAALAPASVLQLRDTLRRVTALYAPADNARDKTAFLTGVEVTDSSWGEWERATAADQPRQA
ncbi:hypothetical protein [Pelomonas cellulosilytica]|uniref:Uncharacterized protein n=1 Tax=Pelomonas cellulosilytica TaxID=2906762 RepID=A0ABS8XPN4_9BURK|nr:hypothetical protein [Pelomonas sp. P8]MCE4554724.1 hypothetical protein [Pelomonas sp. P8]